MGVVYLHIETLHMPDMERNIIQHHPAIDFDRYFRNLNNGFVGIDYNDYLSFFKDGVQTHSFIGVADGENRVARAVADAVGSHGAANLLANADSLMLVVHHSPESERPLATAEMTGLSEFVARLPENCNVTWCLTNDEKLGDAVKVLVLMNVNR